MPYLIDTHAHLTGDEYGSDISQLLANARENSVEKIVAVGFDIVSSEKSVELARRFPGKISASFGVHPHHAEEFGPADLEKVVRAALERDIVAVGEIGLDYYADAARGDRPITPAVIEAQKKTLLSQLDVAVKNGLPAIIHIRDAFDDFKAFTDGIKYRGVIHCYSGDGTFAKWAVEKGLLISFTASVTYPLKALYKEAAAAGRNIHEFLRDPGTREKIPAAVKFLESLPLSSVMIETDCPYLTPHPFRGKRVNEPALVKYVAECVAGIMNLPLDEFAEATSHNAEKFFGI